MNKIVLDKDSIINISIDKTCICNIDDCYNIKELNLEIKDNVKFILNHYDEINSKDLFINITQNNNSEFIYNHSFINNKEYNLNININLLGRNSKNTISIHGLSDKGTSKIIVDGSIDKGTLDNELYESIKMINVNDGKSHIYPNMYVSAKNVVANHAASISTINDDYLFYLMCKGIDKENATKLIIEGFLDNVARQDKIVT